MKTIRDNIGCPLSDKGKTWVSTRSTPGALRSCGAEGILEIQAYREWLDDYRQGCSHPEVINGHIDIFSGYSAEEEKALIGKRIKASLTWYTAYKEGNVSKDDIRQLSAEFGKYKLKDLSAGQSLKNEFMINAFAAYLLHQKDFPKEKEQVYWNVVIKSLETFIEKAQ